MNRDEKRSRETALTPQIVDLSECRAIFPREAGGGTWIAANDGGVCLALINWHRIEREPAGQIVSRGHIVSELSGSRNSNDIANGLTNLPLKKIRPFRLIAIVLKEKAVTEWRWDLRALLTRRRHWRRLHWFSSGYNERKAESVRRRICDDKSTNGIGELRELHRSHAPERGPFSICMHRNDASTVSYTEVTVEDRKVTMRYKTGPPCSASPTVAKVL